VNIYYIVCLRRVHVILLVCRFVRHVCVCGYVMGWGSVNNDFYARTTENLD
jgi:hypothetical protein